MFVRLTASSSISEQESIRRNEVIVVDAVPADIVKGVCGQRGYNDDGGSPSSARRLFPHGIDVIRPHHIAPIH